MSQQRCCGSKFSRSCGLLPFTSLLFSGAFAEIWTPLAEALDIWTPLAEALLSTRSESAVALAECGESAISPSITSSISASTTPPCCFLSFASSPSSTSSLTDALATSSSIANHACFGLWCRHGSCRPSSERHRKLHLHQIRKAH